MTNKNIDAHLKKLSDSIAAIADAQSYLCLYILSDDNRESDRSRLRATQEHLDRLSESLRKS